MRALQTSLSIAVCMLASVALASEKDAGPASPLSVELKAQAISAGEQVLLEEIAMIQGLDDDTWTALKKCTVGRAAPAGQSRVFQTQEVLAAMRRNGCAAQVAFKGAASVTVTAAAESITGKMFADAAMAAVRAHFANDPDLDLDVEIEITSLPADLQLRPGEISVTAVTPDGGFRPGSQSARVSVVQAGRRIIEPVVGLKVKVSGSVQVAAARMNTGDILADADIKTMRKEMNATDFLNRTNAQRLVGMRAKKAINADEALNKSYFAMPQVIKRGGSVTVYVKRGALLLVSRGEAKSDAALDEPVRILIADSNAEVVARASGDHEATIDDPNQRRNRQEAP